MVQTATAATATPENPTAIFDTAIADAERLLELFDKLSKPEQQANEVLKRAAFMMTLTTWENYIKSWLKVQIRQKLAALTCSFADYYIQKKFCDAINQLYNPNAFKVLQLCLDFLLFNIVHLKRPTIGPTLFSRGKFNIVTLYFI